MLDFLRMVRSWIFYLGAIKIGGVHIDFVLHFFVAVFLVLILARFLSQKWTITIVSVLVVLKELSDIFGKSRLTYIRPPTMDVLIDLIFGFLGLAVGIGIHRLWKRKKENHK